ncbi:hypothetical protein LVJ94_49025 [Pendulispora rubella]|uniref:Uncharacterized protein n=1 Tax=Pendulispora rubella TaxID=2741070 RepID=A0ABZ2L3A8_9BACT
MAGTRELMEVTLPPFRAQTRYLHCPQCIMFASNNSRGLHLERANLRWSVNGHLVFAHPSNASGSSILDRVRQIPGAKIVQEEGYLWRAKFTDRPNLFCNHEVVVTMTDSEESWPESMDVEIYFETSSTTTFAFAWLVLSVVGIPFAFAWRARSIQRCRALARKLLSQSTFEESLVTRVTDGPYR